MQKNTKKVATKDTKQKPKSQIAKNGRILRAVADWLSNLATKDGKGFSAAKKRRADRITNDNNKTGDEILYILGQTGRTGGFIFLKLFELISRTTNIALVDNALFRKIEQKYAELKHDDKKFAAWLKKHPAVSSYFTVWLTTALLLLGRAGYKKFKEPATQDNKAKTEVVQNPEKTQQVPIVKTYDITDNNFVQEFFDDNWNNFVIFLSEFETYREKPVLQHGERRYTYGPGLTWVYEKQKNGTYKQHPCTGKWKDKAANFTTNQIWEQVQLHMLIETLPIMKQSLVKKVFKNVPENQLFALVVAGYQLSGHIPDIVAGLQSAKDDIQKCADAFSYWELSHNSQWYKGTMKRRWWCANIYLGYVDCHDLLDLNRDVFSAVDFSVIKPKDKSFTIDASTLAYALLKTNDKSTVREFIAAKKLISNPDVCYTKPANTAIIMADPSMMAMIDGLKNLRTGKYEASVECYLQAIKLNPDNIAAYSDLSLVYKTYADNTKDQAQAIIYYEKCCEQLDNINKHMEKNPNLELDDENMAYVNFNVGMAKDALAKIYTSRGDNAKAVEYYEQAITHYANAKEYGTKAGIESKHIKTYEKRKSAAEINYKAMKKAKTTAFNRANSKLKVHSMMEKQSQIINNKSNEYA